MISHGLLHHIIHDNLNYNKISAREVPKQLTHELKECCVNVCEMSLQHYED